MVLGDENTLNIFTDASLITTDTKEYITCSGAIAVANITTENPVVVDRIFTINYNSTNNHGELTAILNGIEIANRLQNQFTKLNLFSDSKISVFGLRDWCTKWFNNIVGDPYATIVSSSGAPVSNQEVIIAIIKTIVTNNIRISIYHQNGHVDPSSPKEVNAAMQVFNGNNYFDCDRNRIHADYKDVCLISLFNGMVDCISRDYLRNIDRSRNYNRFVRPLQYGMTLDLFNSYRSLINMKGGTK